MKVIPDPSIFLLSYLDTGLYISSCNFNTSILVIPQEKWQWPKLNHACVRRAMSPATPPRHLQTNAPSMCLFEIRPLQANRVA